MEFHINSPQGSAQESTDDRLRKAIERNRAKQARRSNTMVGANSQTMGAQPQSRFGDRSQTMVGGGQSQVPNDWSSPGMRSQNQNHTASSNFEAATNRFNNMNSGRAASSTPSHARRNTMVGGNSMGGVNGMNSMGSTAGTSSARMATAQGSPTMRSSRLPGSAGPAGTPSGASATTRARMANSANMGTATGATATRRSVAGLNQEQEILENPKRKRKAAASIAYSSKKTKKKKKSVASSLMAQRLVKGAWVLCLVLFVRLIFTDGGIIDYYSTKNLLKLKNDELQSIRTENTALRNEIERIKGDKAYQKKLVRDNLGFIAKNEYLVLFPKESN